YALVEGRLCCDQPLVVEERPAESALEEVVGDGVVGSAIGVQVLVDGQRGRLVVAHRQPDRITSGEVAVLLSVVELVLLLVEAMHDVLGASPCKRTWRVGRHAMRVRERRTGRGAGRAGRQSERTAGEKRLAERGRHIR